jgi:hypothetical protein
VLGLEAAVGKMNETRKYNSACASSVNVCIYRELYNTPVNYFSRNKVRVVLFIK